MIASPLPTDTSTTCRLEKHLFNLQRPRRRNRLSLLCCHLTTSFQRSSVPTATGGTRGDGSVVELLDLARHYRNSLRMH
jgi:hypothetical protein